MADKDRFPDYKKDVVQQVQSKRTIYTINRKFNN